MVTSEPNSGSVGESPTPVDTVPEPGGGEDPPRPPSVATTEASGMDGTQEEASMDVAQEEGGSPDVSVVVIDADAPPSTTPTAHCAGDQVTDTTNDTSHVTTSEQGGAVLDDVVGRHPSDVRGMPPAWNRSAVAELMVGGWP